VWLLSPNLRTPNPGFITNTGGAVKPGLNPGFGLLRCGSWGNKLYADFFYIVYIVVETNVVTLTNIFIFNIFMG
jgi:hypothetical protein